METFKINESFYEKLNKKTKNQFNIFLFIFCVAFLLPNFLNDQKLEITTKILSLFFFIGFMLYLKFTLKRIANTQEQLYKSYKITFSDDDIKKELKNDRGQIVLIKNITQIIKLKDGSFFILGKASTEFLHINKEIEKLDLLEEKLKSILPITINTKETIIEKYGKIIGASIVITLICLFFSIFIIKNIYYLYTILFLVVATWLYLKYFFKTENPLVTKMIKLLNKFLIYLICMCSFNLLLNHFTSRI